jgi:hypothetical protein
MYPSAELNRLAGSKTALRAAIRGHRRECARAADRVLKPVELLERAIAAWKRVRPFVRLAVALLALEGRRRARASDHRRRHGAD